MQSRNQATLKTYVVGGAVCWMPVVGEGVDEAGVGEEVSMVAWPVYLG